MSPCPAVFQVLFFEPPSNGKHMFGLGPCKTRRLCEIPVVCWTKVINTRKWKYSLLGRSCRGNTGVAGTEDSACRQERKWRDIHSGFAFPKLRSECFWHGSTIQTGDRGTFVLSGNRCLGPVQRTNGTKASWPKNSLRSSNKKGEDPRWFKYEIRIEMWGKL